MLTLRNTPLTDAGLKDLAGFKKLTYLDLYDTNLDEAPQLTKFLEILDNRRTLLLQQREDIDAVLAEVDGLVRQCRRLLDRDRRGRT